MRLLPLLLFIGVPLVELAILIKVGEVIGVLPTIALVIFTAVVGVSLLKRQGLAVLDNARRSLDAGEVPVQSVADGACLLVAGAFLLTPGLLTDTAGFLLLIPGFRRWLARWLFDKLIASGKVHVHASGMPPGGGSAGPGAPRGGGKGPVIEGEYEDVDADTPARDEEETRARVQDKSSPWRK